MKGPKRFQSLLKKDKTKEHAGNHQKKNTRTTEKAAPLDQAKNIAQIVDDGIRDRNFGKMNSELGDMAEDAGREYVFTDYHPIRNRIIALAAIGFLIVLIVYMVNAAMVIRYSYIYRTGAMAYLVCFLILCLADLLILRKCLVENRFETRYQKYYYLMKYKKIVLTEELADYVRVSEKQVIADITLAIRRDLIPEGYFGMDNELIILSSGQYREYQDHRIAYDQYYSKILDDYRRGVERPEEIQKILDTGEEYVRKIHEDNERIKDREISDRLDEMENTVNTIFREVDLDPGNADKLGMLLNYYLPTTEKLLQTYIDLDEKHVQSRNADKAKQEITDSLEATNKAYQRILDGFFVSREMEVSSDIESMSEMMKQEGLVNDESAD